MLTNIFQPLDALFDNHTSLVVLFSGIGIALVPFILSLVKKIYRFICSKITTKQSNPPDSIPPKAEKSSELKIDIQAIRNCIAYGLNQEQENLYYIYYYKYKDKFIESEILSLEKSITDSKNEFNPYKIPLCILLGLLEKL